MSFRYIRGYNIDILVTDLDGNIRIYRLSKGRGTDEWPEPEAREISISRPYQDPRAICLS